MAVLACSGWNYSTQYKLNLVWVNHVENGKNKVNCIMHVAGLSLQEPTSWMAG